MTNRVTLTAATEEQADALLEQLIDASEAQFGKASADDVRHHAQIVADRLGIAFCVDAEGNIRFDNGSVRWSGRP